MVKTLVVVAHPDIEKSVINKKWINELKKYPEKYTIHELYKTYPEGTFDIEREQKLIESHENLILQFPIQWFNSPSLLKKWLDDVFVYGWAYGSNDSHLKGRKVALAVSAGIRQSDYSENGRYGHILEQILVPFEITMFYCGAEYRSIFAFYGEEGAPGGTEEEEIQPEKDKLTESALSYVEFINSL